MVCVYCRRPGAPLRAHDDASARARRRQGLQEQEHGIRRPAGIAGARASRGVRRGRRLRYRPGGRCFKYRPPLGAYESSDRACAARIGASLESLPRETWSWIRPLAPPPVRRPARARLVRLLASGAPAGVRAL
jgi:hypothetical protein